MKRTLAGLLSIVTLAGALTSTQALAQPNRDRYELRQDRQELRADRRHFRQDRHAARRHWRRGQRLDRRYGSYSTVNDWRAHRLSAPRRGYHWVRSGDDYVLAALTSGLIASVVAANR